ncbi:hypothetical protein HMPREF9123_2214 [Neisseria bacilliformis ATCC BAA-1200]|uniref:Uncharacterized protein n=1 Tax=Neisseria bacilliformis ATCC BAA-1200 TaxID=888742 RepID=F2BEQ7_9NEIS|nr:hypothetical protein HMPREF9123_2214 [Neisseria bacilliformis ATCC BAA-1200]
MVFAARHTAGISPKSQHKARGRLKTQFSDGLLPFKQPLPFRL